MEFRVLINDHEYLVKVVQTPKGRKNAVSFWGYGLQWVSGENRVFQSGFPTKYSAYMKACQTIYELEGQ